MDDVLQSALEPVLSDLGDSGVSPAAISDDDSWTDVVDSCRAMVWSANGSGAGIYVSRSATPSERIAAAADQVQEWAVEELWSIGRSTSWPECPQHPRGHPLQAVVRGGDAWWVCPRDRALVVRVGALSG